MTVNPGGGRDFSRLYDAEANLPSPLTQNYEIDCYGSVNDTKETVFNVVTLNGSTQYTLLVKGDNTTGIFNDAKYQIAMTGGTSNVVTIATTYVTCEYVQVTGALYSNCAFMVTSPHTTIRNCLVQDFTGGTSTGIWFYNEQTGGNLAYNNVVWNCDCGIRIWQSIAAGYNNTVSGCGTYGLYTLKANGSATWKNNLVTGSGTADYFVNNNGDGTIVTAKNFTGDATSPDAGCGEATITFVGGEDYHLDPTMNRTMRGVDLSTIFTTDFTGQTKLWWDPGADEMSTPQKLMRIAHGGIMAGNQRRQQ